MQSISMGIWINMILNTYLLVPAICSLILLALILAKRKIIKRKKGNAILISIISFSAIYSIILSTSFLLDILGVTDENSPNHSISIRFLTSDYGQTTLFLNALVFSFVISVLIYSTIKTFKVLREHN